MIRIVIYITDLWISALDKLLEKMRPDHEFKCTMKDQIERLSCNLTEIKKMIDETSR